MLKRIRFSLRGSKPIVESVAPALRPSKVKVEHYPFGSVLRLQVLEGSPEHAQVERLIQEYELDVSRYETLEASADELKNELFFQNSLSKWIDDTSTSIDKPLYTGSDACPVCGKGAMQLASPLTGKWQSFRRSGLRRYPPALIVASTSVGQHIEKSGWTGMRVRPVLERKTRSESPDMCQLEITSILPPMDASAQIERSCIPEFCPVCRKLGYQLSDFRPVYSRKSLEPAADFNWTSEWLAPHYFSCPRLICSRAVVTYLMVVVRAMRWIPLKYVD